MESDGKFGAYLRSSGLVSQAQLDRARDLQASYGFLRIGEILVHQGSLDFGAMLTALNDYRSQCKMGQLLVLEGAITKPQLDHALELQAKSGILLGKVLVDLKICSLEQVMSVLSTQRQVRAAA